MLCLLSPKFLVIWLLQSGNNTSSGILLVVDWRRVLGPSAVFSKAGENEDVDGIVLVVAGDGSSVPLPSSARRGRMRTSTASCLLSLATGPRFLCRLQHCKAGENEDVDGIVLVVVGDGSSVP